MGVVEQTLEAVNMFQEATASRDGFEEALTALCDIYDADAVTIEVYSRETGKLELFETARLDPDNIIEYADHYHAISPRVAAGLGSENQPVQHDLDVLSMEEMNRHPFYCEFLPKFGLKYFLSLHIDPSPDAFAVVAFQFRPQHGIVERSKLQLALAMQPLLQRAMSQSWRSPSIEQPSLMLAADFAEEYGLTASEMQLGLALKSGVSIPEYAERLGLSRNTVYTHYARLKEKLGCRRQSELLARLNNLR